jgi:hypothetical protein
MAYDLLSGKKSGKDWSRGDGEIVVSGEGALGAKIAGAGLLCLAVAAILVSSKDEKKRGPVEEEYGGGETVKLPKETMQDVVYERRRG